MHNIFAGLVGFFMSLGTLLHGGNALAPQATQPTPTQQTVQGGTAASPSGTIRGKFGGRNGRALPQGEQRFFATVTAINGATLTVQMQPRMRSNNTMGTVTGTPPAMQIRTILLDSTTTYTGGAQADIIVNTKIAGIGKTNTDGSITAIQVRINPTTQTGLPRRQNFTQ